MHEPLAIANYFVQKSFETGIELTPMKVIKLVYIAHGWHLGLIGPSLLNESVQAWKYGPVVESVYQEFKNYGDQQIQQMGSTFIGLKQVMPILENEETAQFLDDVWDTYKDYSGLELSTLTHQKGTPWDRVFNAPENKGKRHIIIPNELIREHYTEKLNANRKALEVAV